MHVFYQLLHILYIDIKHHYAYTIANIYIHEFFQYQSPRVILTAVLPKFDISFIVIHHAQMFILSLAHHN